MRARAVAFLLLIAFAAQRLLYPNSTIFEVAGYPWVTVLAQLIAYIVVLLFMVSLVKRVPGESFRRAIRWNWPQSWSAYFFGGVLLALALQGLAHFLPMPKELPIDRFFRTPREAWALSLFGVTLAPLLEEFFFRGFLYPVLVRRLGVVAAILLTSASFGIIHAPQLGRACCISRWTGVDHHARSYEVCSSQPPHAYRIQRHHLRFDFRSH